MNYGDFMYLINIFFSTVPDKYFEDRYRLLCTYMENYLFWKEYFLGKSKDFQS